MISHTPTRNTVSTDVQISKIMAILFPEKPVEISLNGKTGVLVDQEQYDGLLETLRILQEDQTILSSLAQREAEELISEEEFLRYV